MKTTHRGPWARGAWRRSGLVLVLTLAVAASLVAGSTAWAQGKTITLSMLAGFKEDVLRANLPEFEKKTGIKVLIDAAPIGDLYKKQVLSLSTAARYDVMFMDEPWIAPLSEFLLPLTERARGYDMTDFVPTALAAGAFQGVQYALPVDPNMQLLVYRKDLFDQKGMKPPATWDELLAAAKAFTDPAKEQYGIAITASSDIQTCLYMLVSMWSQGAELVTAEGKGGVDTPAGRKGAEIFLELLKYAPPNVRSYTFPDVNKAIQTGQVAMAIQWASGAKPHGGPDPLHRGRQARLHPGAEGGPADADARRVDDRHRQEQQQPGRRLGVREVAQQQGVRARGDQVPERLVRDPQPAGLGPPGPRDQGRPPVRRGAPREPHASPRSARGFASSPTSRSTSGSPPASSRPASSPSTPP